MKHTYKQYFDSMPSFLTVQDREFRVIDANKKFIKEFGDYEGRHCYQVYKHRPEKCEVCPVERTFHDGEPHQSEELIKTLDGREVCVLVNTTPIRNGTGEISAVMEMSTDITDIKRLQSQFKESQTRYQMLFEEVPCYISIQDRDLRIVEANRLHREAFGTAYGKYCYDVFKHRSKECLPCNARQTFQDGIVRTQESVVTSKSGERANVLVLTAPIKNADGEIDKVVEMSTDITEIRQLQDKLTSIGLLIGSISHTIKGLLNGLDGAIYLVNSGLKKDDRGRIDQGWEIAIRNVDRIRTLVMNILYYAKDRELNWQGIAIKDFMDDVCKIMHEKAKQLNIELKCNVSDDIGEFEVDSEAARSLFINLLENSLDACRTDTKKVDHSVALSIQGNPENVVFLISDNGIGMDQETKEKAFSLFFSSKGAGGTGLGLFVADKIAQSHGGSITIESEQGEWCRLTVTLPRKRPMKTEEKIVIV